MTFFAHSPLKILFIGGLLSGGCAKSWHRPRDEPNLGRIEARMTSIPAVVCKE
jgi:hypothetical protein